MEVLVLFEKIYLKPPIPFGIFMPKSKYQKWKKMDNGENNGV
jgi:hypothetical protein